MTFMRKNGERFHALVYEAKLIDGNGKHTGWMASVLDITERKRAEELARQQQEQLQFTSRLVTMGEMASTLAHELNQPLAAIASYNTGCLNLLANGQAQPGDLQPALEKIGAQAQRAGKIIRRVHDFVRKSEPKRAPCQLGEIIEDCVGFIEAEARKHHVRIECDTPPALPVLADRLMLEQVLLNLMRNGMEAMAATPHERPPVARRRPGRGQRTVHQRQRQRQRHPAGGTRQAVHRLLHHQTGRHGHRSVDLPVDHRIPPRPPVGRGQRPFADRKRYDLHFTLPLGQRMSAPQAYLVDDDEAIRDALVLAAQVARHPLRQLRLCRALPGSVEQERAAAAWCSTSG